MTTDYIRHINQYITLCHSSTYGHHYIARTDIPSHTLIHACAATYTTQPYSTTDHQQVSQATYDIALHLLQHPTQYKYLSSPVPHTQPTKLPTDLHYFTPTQWHTAIHTVQCNSMQVNADDTGNLVQQCIYPAISLYNHSCQPNACIYYHNGHAHVYTIQPVYAHQQLYICYRADLMHMTTHQRQIISSIWHFTCTCSLCTNTSLCQRLIESDIHGRSIAHETEYLDKMVNYVDELIQQSDSEVPPPSWLTDIDTLLLHNNTLHNAHWLLHKLRTAVMPVLLGSLMEQTKQQQGSGQDVTDARRQYVKQWCNKLLKILTLHLDSTVLIEPALHSSKLQLYNTYELIAVRLMRLPSSVVGQSLKRIDPSYDLVTHMYSSDDAIKQQNELLADTKLVLD